MKRLGLIVLASCAGAESHAPPAPAPVADPAPAPAPEAAPVPEPVPVPVPAADPDPRAETITLAFAGDVMFGRFIEGGFREIPAEHHNPFEHVNELLDSDFTMVNLETPVMRSPPKKSPYGHRMRFVTTPERVATLKANNIDGVTIANNHAFDMHGPGLKETPVILGELGLEVVGEHDAELPVLRAETVEVGGWKIGFIPATTERNWAEGRRGVYVPATTREGLEKALRPVVEAARADHDLVIVVLHWGDEYEDLPEKWQVKAARAFVDAGADAVVAHHPHVLQGIERYGDGVIAYSIGNFVFDNLHGRKRLHGILRLTFRHDGDRGCLDAGAFHPTVGTRPRFTPKPAGKEFDTVAERLQTLSRKKPLRATEWTIDEAADRLTVAGTCSGDQ